MRGTAFDWARETLTQDPKMRASELLVGLSNRFLSRLKITETAQRFLSDEISDTSEKFFAMMRDANYLFENGYMSLLALVDRIISRSPSEIRITLWNSSGVSKNMFEFSKAVDKVIPLVYGKEGSMNAVETSINRAEIKKAFGGKPNNKYCDLYGRKGHSTEECITLKKLGKSGWTKKEFPVINRVEPEGNDKYDEVKQVFFYSFKATSSLKNPFFLTGKILEKNIPILIDTGADITLASKHLLPNGLTIKRTTQSAKAANGGQIHILGFIENITISINNQNIHIRKALITSANIHYLLLGAPEISRYLSTITNIIKTKIQENKKKTEFNVRVAELGANLLAKQKK